MKDPEHGDDKPSNGARGPRGNAGEKHSRPSSDGRSAQPRPPLDGKSDDPAAGNTGKSRKRRKRKRGRKVYARDGAVPSQSAHNGAVPNPAQQQPAPPERSAQPPTQGRPTHARELRHEQGVYAALDLGTNNCRLLVAIPGRNGQFRVIDAFSRIVRLGEGLAASGRLSDGAMDRAVEALKVCADKLRNRRLKRVRLIATEACRSAANGAEFIARVKRETGLALEIIDRKTEARLAVSGCGSLVERETKGVVLFDIGGGSSEIALIDLSRHRTPRLANHIVSWTSLPVGVVSLSERFGGQHVTREIFEAMVEDVAGMLTGFEGRDRLSHVLSEDGFHLLGTSGTVTTLAGIHLGLERYDRRRVDGLWLQNAEVDTMIATLLDWEFEKRVANPCIGADRADLVLGGCAILEAIRRVWPSNRLRVADRGLREGMLSELMADDGVWRRARKRRPTV
ncbi:Ppx/GppA phosphatase family protein [Aliihoeflea sp. PC F10.4]